MTKWVLTIVFPNGTASSWIFAAEEQEMLAALVKPLDDELDNHGILWWGVNPQDPQTLTLSALMGVLHEHGIEGAVGRKDWKP